MLIFSLTLLYFFIAIQDADSHVLRTRDPDPTTVNVKQPRNLDIERLIDPLQQPQLLGDLDGEKLSRSVFSVPGRGSSASSALDCPQGTRRIVENGPCLQETPTIKTSGDKFLVDSLRKFYTPNTHHMRPHHRKRRPSSTTAASTTTTRRHEFVPAYIIGDIDHDHGHESLKPDDDTLTISGAAAISSPTNEFPTTEIIITTKVNSVTQPTVTTNEAATEEAKTVMPEPMSPTTPAPFIVTDTTVSESETQGFTDVNADERLVFETATASTPSPTEVETTLRYDEREPAEVTTDIVQLTDADGDKSRGGEPTTTETTPMVTENPTLHPLPPTINMAIENEEGGTGTAPAATALTNVLSPTTVVEKGKLDTKEADQTTMPMNVEFDETEIVQTESTPTPTKIEFIETAPTITTPPEIPTLAPNPSIPLENMDVDPQELNVRPGRAPIPTPTPASLPVWAQVPRRTHTYVQAPFRVTSPQTPQHQHQHPQSQPQQQPVRQRTHELPVQVDIRNGNPVPLPRSTVTHQHNQQQRLTQNANVHQNQHQQRNLHLENMYPNDFVSLDYVNSMNSMNNPNNGWMRKSQFY